MAITPEQRAKLEALAKERGLDIEQLVAQGEEIIAARGKPPSPAAAKTPPSSPAAKTPVPALEDNQPKLFQYHLPFVTVNEVRTKWLGLDAWSPEDGGDDNAAAFAAETMGAPSSTPSSPANATPERPDPTSVPGAGVPVPQ